MIRPTHFLLPALLILLAACNKQKNQHIAFRAKTVDSTRYEMPYQAGHWEHPDYSNPFSSLGNHRIELFVEDPAAELVQARIPWRRSDIEPAQKAVFVTEARSGKLVTDKLVLEVTNAHGLIVFKPVPGIKNYYIYYLPHRSSGGYYPRVSYISPGEEPDDTTALAGLNVNNAQLDQVPQAQVISAQSIDAFHSFFPMEVIATQEEVNRYTEKFPAPFYVFPEYREYSIRMQHHLPLRWVSKVKAINGLKDTIPAGTYFTFQLGLYSPLQDLSRIRLTFTDLHGKKEDIPAGDMTCFNTQGTDLQGKPFRKVLNVPAATVQALWCGIAVPDKLATGDYSGQVFITPEGLPTDTIHISLTVTDKSEDQNNNIYDMSRLNWLNSTIGSNKETIIPPFLPLEIKDKTIHLLGRDIELDPLGFPAGIYSYFTQEMTHLKKEKEALLFGAIGPDVVNGDGMPVHWMPEDYTIDHEAPGIATWQATSRSDELTMIVNGRAEYDGMLNYDIRLVALNDQQLENFSLHIPLKKQAAEYMLGLGYKGCKRPDEVSWKWDVENKHQEGAWLGCVNKGLQYVLRDENYERPLNTNFYRQKPLEAPGPWYNDGKGGISITTEKDFVNVNNYTGPLRMKKGDTLNFVIRFLVTPFKTIDTKAHFNTRFVHKYVPVDSVVAWNGTVVNVHHANEINPYINYPFFNITQQKAYIDEAHKKGIKVKLYNTIRELTYKAPELFALKSLGDEVLNDGVGGGHSWLQEHLSAHYHAAWHATSVNDAAVLNKGNSRWTNYYIEGINWLAENQHIDGLYLDDIAFSRTTVKRLSAVLHQHREEVVIDLHSANQFNARDGYINSAFLYMEHMPYISRLWFGEYFEYDLGPDYWITEVSGIPFGLTGEMLEGGGHPYRGLVYGMTSRIYGDIDMRPMWELFDDFGIASSEMLGYWVDRCPVKTAVADIKSTVYVQEGKVLIAIGSWSNQNLAVPLHIDWESLGMEPAKATLYSPAIRNLQEYQVLDLTKPIPVQKQQGIILVLEQADKTVK